MDDALDPFLARLLAIEDAWAQLDDAGLMASRDAPAAAERVRALPVLDLQSSPLLVRAADMLAAWGHEAEARDMLAAGHRIDGPAAPLHLSHARRLQALNDLAGARTSYRASMIRARPDATLLLEYAAFEQAAGDAAGASAVAAIAGRFRAWSLPALMERGRQLRALGRADLAAAAFILAFRRGCRAPDCLTEILAVRAAAAPALAEPYDADVAGGPTLLEAVATMAAQAKLAQSLDRDALIGVAELREASAGHLSVTRLHAMLADRIAASEPFSMIRLGDGEGRFLLARKPALRGVLTRAEAAVTGKLIWSVWFGDDIARVDGARLDALTDRFDAAVGRADIIGLPLAARLTADAANLAYLAAVLNYVAEVPTDAARRFTDASVHLALDRADPFLDKLLGGTGFLGVVGPHPDLALRLQRRLGIDTVAAYDIPGEGRLARPREAGDRGQHFPAAFDRVMAELAVPYRGAPFLVAGGLLGKIYCDRVKQLGGIALDIGALADAWMGFNTRGTSLDATMLHRLPA